MEITEFQIYAAAVLFSIIYSIVELYPMLDMPEKSKVDVTKWW